MSPARSSEHRLDRSFHEFEEVGQVLCLVDLRAKSTIVLGLRSLLSIARRNHAAVKCRFFRVSRTTWAQYMHGNVSERFI